MDFALAALCPCSGALGYLGSAARLRRMRSERDRARRAAVTDALTGLANRAGLDRAMRNLAAGRSPYGVALVDLDGFKQVNDSLGHAAGDAVLAEVARRLAALLTGCRDSIAARLGGDEFVLAAPAPAPAVTLVLGHEIVRALAAPVVMPVVGALAVRASVGVAHAMPGDDPEEALRAADVAMYTAKTTHGGGTVVEHDPATGLPAVGVRPGVRLRDMVGLARGLGEVTR